MQLSYWEQVVADGYRVPQGAALDDLTLELATMLGDADPSIRDGIACSVLEAWIGEGVYDQLLSGFGDGLLPALRDGLGDDGTPTVFGRSYAARVLGAVVARDNTTHSLHPAVVLTWADRAVAWLLAERDLRGWVDGCGWAHAGANGADLLGNLTASRYIGVDELSVLLDVIAERLLAPTTHRFDAGEDDRLALATMSLLCRDLVPADTVEGWLDRLSTALAADDADDLTSPGPVAPWRANTLGYLRALHLQLILGVRHTPAQSASSRVITAPAVRADVLIALQQALRTSQSFYTR